MQLVVIKITHFRDFCNVKPHTSLITRISYEASWIGKEEQSVQVIVMCDDAEYALKDMTKPIGVSEYKLLEDLPSELQETVPSLEDMESRIIDKYKCE